MFAAIRWDTPLPWEKKVAMSDQEAANRAAAGLMDQMGPITLRKTTTSRIASTSSPPTSNSGNMHLVNRALVPSAEQMMSNALIGSSASRYAVIKERRTGFFLDTSQDNLPLPEKKSQSDDSSIPRTNIDTNQKSIPRRNSTSVCHTGHLTPQL